jgi:hypothetical protein
MLRIFITFRGLKAQSDPVAEIVQCGEPHLNRTDAQNDALGLLSSRPVLTFQMALRVLSPIRAIYETVGNNVSSDNTLSAMRNFVHPYCRGPRDEESGWQRKDLER